jgi:hypothetical protein
MQLQDFYDYKNQLMKDIITNKTLVGLLIDDSDDVENINALSLAYTQVFPYEYVPQTVQEGKTFICFDVDISRTYNKTFYSPILYVWVFAHRSNLRLPEGGVRVDKICNELALILNGSRNYCLGELDLSTVKRFAPMTDFQGKVLTFTGKEFNRNYDGDKKTPVKRKGGVQ